MVDAANLLRITDLKKSFRSGVGESVLVLDVPEFHLGAGALLGLRGESGCGKTTFLNIISGLLQPDAGQVELAGVITTSLREAARDRHRAANIGYVHQSFNLLEGMTVMENIRAAMSFGRGEDPARAEALLERVGLRDFARQMAGVLSSGQKQRVAVARALANHPRLVLADEPTASLDRRNRDEVLDLLLATCREQGAALLLVSHDEAVLAGFDQVQDFSSLNRAMEATP
jgi:putative ABC transport system ATP-binding protein